jgi:uncharacterized protein YaiL (DUF2058 family)
MADLREQMLKAGLITEDQARKGTHEKRQRDKKLGREGKAKEAEVRKEEVRQSDTERARQDQALAQQENEQRANRAQAAQERQRKQALVERALKEGALPRWEGQRTYYFRDGKEILFLQVNDETARLLESGKAAIVRGNGRSRYTVIQSGAALQLLEGAAERVVTFHR